MSNRLIPAEPLLITVDTREQRPWEFGELRERKLVDTRRAACLAGDYMIGVPFDEYPLSHWHAASIERKSLNDYIHCITSDWFRFKEQLKNMLSLCATGCVCVVVEADWNDIEKKRYQQIGVPQVRILAATANISTNFVPVYFAGRRENAMTFAYYWLKQTKEKMERRATC
jgi:ERCC4-type nuclease